jgi:hypothetical protein
VANNLGVQFFTDAKAQYESAGKWRWIVVALLAYLQVGLVVPFAADTRDKAAVDRQLADNRAAQEALKFLLDAADKLAKDVNGAKDKVAADLEADLVERFKRLSEAVNKLAALDPAQAAGDEGVAPRTLPPQQMQQRTQQQTVPEDPSALAPMSADLRRRIVETAAGRPGEVPPELQAYIESELIEPAFKHANQAWATSGLMIAQGGAAEIAEGIAKAKAAAPAAQLDSLGKSVEALGNEAQSLTFKPPEDPDWWRTVPGKEASIRSMTFEVAARVSDLTSSEKDLQTQTTEITEIVGKNRQDAAALNDTLVELNNRATALQSQLGEIGAPLKVVAFKLSEIAPLMPLIIAATLAAIAAWTAEGLRRMTLAARLVGDEADGTAIRTWLHAAAGGSRARVAGVELAVAIASVAWVLAAVWNVAPLPPSFLTQPILAAIALAVVVAARAYHWRRADEAASAGER